MKSKGIIFTVAAISAVFAIAGCGTQSGGSGTSGWNSSRSISVISREDGSGTRGAFIELFGIEEKSSDGSKVDLTSDEAIIANKTDVMLTNVSGDEYAIGYVSLGSLNENVKALDIDGAEANAENVKNGSYKVARPFNIATTDHVSELAEDFISFILSAEGQAVAEDGYIPVDDNATPYAGTKPAGKIVVAGSSSVSPLMEKLKEAYLKINTAAEIEIQTNDSTSGMNGAMEGTCDIGMASRDLKESEAAKLTAVPIALDGIAVIVNSENPVNSLSSENVKDIFTGTITAWNEITEQ